MGSALNRLEHLYLNICGQLNACGIDVRQGSLPFKPEVEEALLT